MRRSSTALRELKQTFFDHKKKKSKSKDHEWEARRR
jgi:hypothetical protein